MAMTFWPTRSESESPKERMLIFASDVGLIFITAMSFSSSDPISCAS